MTKRRKTQARKPNSKSLSRKRRANDKFTPAEVITALEMSAGILAHAASKLGCSHTTIASYVSRYPDVSAALNEILETRLDIAEGILLKRMADDRHPQLQLTAATFYLKTKGKHRGYVERQEQTGPGGEFPKIQIDLSTLTDGELDLLDRHLNAIAREPRHRPH